MMPGMSGLVPSIAPYLPSGRVTELPGAATLHAKDGDTITLRAGFIRKTIRGHDVSMFGYNGRSPGPLIDVERGATMIVRVVNALDAATAVHWHGVRLDNPFDGTLGLTQPPIASGRSFLYRCDFRTLASTGITRMFARIYSSRSDCTATSSFVRVTLRQRAR